MLVATSHAADTHESPLGVLATSASRPLVKIASTLRTKGVPRTRTQFLQFEFYKPIILSVSRSSRPRPPAMANGTPTKDSPQTLERHLMFIACQALSFSKFHVGLSLVFCSLARCATRGGDKTRVTSPRSLRQLLRRLCTELCSVNLHVFDPHSSRLTSLVLL